LIVFALELVPMIVRRLALVFSIAVVGSLVAAAVAVAAGGGLGPGKYTFSSTSANAFFGGGAKGGPPAPTFVVSVNQGLNSFQPMHPKGPRVVMNSTMVFLTEFDSTGVGGSGCFVIPASDFTVAKNLQSAALHATLTADEACPGYGTPVGAGKNVIAYAGGGGGLVLPITVDVSWTGNGVISTFEDRSSFQCLAYSEDGTSSNSDSSGSASGATSALSGQFTSVSADVSSSDSRLDIKGTSQPPCFGY
jgi:hypothetical protein